MLSNFLRGDTPYIYGDLGDLSFEEGVAACHTNNDFLLLEQEYASLSVPGMEEFMQGLVTAGPTKSRHPTPPVLVTLPTQGADEYVVRANAWTITQYLACDVHGFVLSLPTVQVVH